MAGSTNAGSGSITVGASSQLRVTDFQTYGQLNLVPGTAAVPTMLTNAGSSVLSFNGGSRTTIATPATATSFLAGVELNGKNAVVAGGLLVNNGFIIDSATGGVARVVADFGALVKGAGFYQSPVLTQNGGRFQAGNSPGAVSFGSFEFGPAGVSSYVFQVNDATGVAGPTPNASNQVSGWGLVKAIHQTIGSTTTSGNFDWTADPVNKLNFVLQTLANPTTVGNDVAGPMADFDPLLSYSWPAVQWAGAYNGPADAGTLNASTVFDTTGFLNPVAGQFGWSLDTAGHTLSLTYTPVPEPGTLTLTGLAVAGFGWVVRRRRAARA
jgi:hypothetical protein